MSAYQPLETERRILLVAPTRKDAELTCKLLAASGLTCLACDDLRKLNGEMDKGAGAVLLTEEAVAAPGIDELLATLKQQPAWSDLPVLILMRGGFQSQAATRVLSALCNVTLLERPASTRSLVSAVQAAIRGRERQYQMRDQIQAIRQAEATSRELQRLLEIAVEASELGTFHCDMPLRHILWNERCKAHFWLSPDAEIDFDLFYSILHPDDRERTREAVEACVYGRKGYDIEYRTVSRTVSPQGEIRWVRATGRTCCDENGQPTQFDGTTQDITERKRTEDALRRADRHKDEFLATLAHELRNPLAPIRNSLHLLSLSGELSESMEPIRGIMERQVNHMVRLIDDLLDLSRIRSGKIELRKTAVEVATLVASAVETSRPIIDAAGHQLAISLPAEPLTLEADPVRISQVISNLLTNAAKYTTRGGQIWLTARQEGREVVIAVRDTGLGIPPDMLPRVFDMFAQVDRTVSHSQGGLGIGLTLTKNLVEMHGGRIRAYSGGPGEGSEFTVWLPLAPRFQRTSVAAPPASASNTALPLRRRILVVDDLQAAGYVLSRLLEKMGQQVWTATGAASALDMARANPPDLVISDIGMPDMDGYELARRLRSEPKLANSLLVALTGYGQAEDRQKAEEAGFDYHLVKPVSIDALRDLLAALSERSVDDPSAPHAGPGNSETRPL
jgi:PAS domain S-box-containing protein